LQIIFFVAAASYWSSDAGIWEFGTVICTACLAVQLTHLAVETKSWVPPLYRYYKTTTN
jgi:hypothetical protein